MVSTGQMREIDRSMTGYFGIDVARMMENAGRNLADISVPPLLYERMGLEVPALFRDGPVVELNAATVW